MTSSQVLINGLGPLEVTRGRESLRLGGLKQRSVLGALVLQPNRVVPRTRLISALWEEDEPSDAVGTLQVYVANLRRIIDPDRTAGADGPLIQSEGPGYRINVDAYSLDLLRFEQLVADAAAARHARDLKRSQTLLESALGLWRGDLLQDLQGQHFLHGEAAHWGELRLGAERTLIELRLDQGEHEEAIPALERLVAVNTYDESLAGLHMLALYRSGRQAAALRAYAKLRERLVEDLGVEPGTQLQQLEIDILNQAASLLETRSTPKAVFQTTVRARESVVGEPTAHLIVDGEPVPLVGVVFTLGRLPDRNLVLGDEQASRRHAEIRHGGTDHVLFDLGSTNGTFVNDQAVVSHTLANGDTIRIGDTELAFVSSHEE